MEKETGISLLKKELPQLKAIMGLTRKGDDISTLVHQELDYLQSMMLSKPEIEKCLPISIVSAVKSVLKQNLSLDPAMGLVYVKTRNIKVGETWQSVLDIQPSSNGLISIARQAGRLLDVDRPTVEKDANGKVIGVTFRYLVPTVNADGTKGARWKEDSFDESDFERWKTASHNEKARNKQDADPIKLNYANRLYSSWKGGIDPEFARAKAIRHCGLKKSGTNQNELSPINFNMALSNPVVDAKVEQQEENEYTSHEEIKEDKTNFNIPSSNDL